MCFVFDFCMKNLIKVLKVRIEPIRGFNEFKHC